MEEKKIMQKRLLSVREFQVYASVGRNTAYRVIRISGSGIRIGRRLLVDRVKFDRWCENQ